MITTMTPPYVEATEDQRKACEAWLRLHNVPPENTPIEAVFDLDEPVNEWRFEQFATRDGSKFLNAAGDPERLILRRAFKAFPPWMADS